MTLVDLNVHSLTLWVACRKILTLDKLFGTKAATVRPVNRAELNAFQISKTSTVSCNPLRSPKASLSCFSLAVCQHVDRYRIRITNCGASIFFDISLKFKLYLINSSTLLKIVQALLRDLKKFKLKNFSRI